MAKRHRKNQSKRTKTKAGYWVQSYSEAKIDNWFFKQKLNYVYEPVFWLGEKRIVPDWVILPTPELGIDKSIIIEYWGLDYSPSQMKQVSGWVKDAAPKYQKRKNMKEEAYLEMEDYYYIGLLPDDCNDLDYWLPTLLNQALGFPTFQMVDESNDDCLELENDNSVPQNEKGQSKIQWKRIHRKSDTYAS